MHRHFATRLLAVLAALALLATACTPGGTASRGSAQAGKPPAELLDSKLLQAKRIVAADGGGLGVKASDGTVAEVYFPPGSLAADTDVEMLPLTGPPTTDAADLGLGVFVRAKGGAKVDLAGPAMLRLLVKGKAPAKAGLVRLADDGGAYTPVATTVRSDGKATELLAVVDSFSGYAPRELTDDESKAAQNGPPLTSAWVVRVNDTRDTTVEMWKFHYTLALEASGSSPYGTFKGPLTMTLTGKADQALAGVVKVNMDVSGSAKGTANLTVLPPLAPLTPTPAPPTAGSMDVPLAPLVPSTDFGWDVGTGTATVQGTGVLSGSGSGPGMTVTVDPQTGQSSESIPFTVGILDGEVWIVMKGVSFKGKLVPIYAKKK
jgi:hypothetical protein